MKISLHDKTYYNCQIRYEKYHNNRTAIIILTFNDLLCKASVNLPDNDLPKNYIFIKNWAENEGILQELIRLNIIEGTGKTTPCGFVSANICKLITPTKDDQP